MIRKTLALGTMAAIGFAIAFGWPDARRYLKIRQISGWPSHPELVPAEGRTIYPQTHSAGAPDGTGDFESAHRGGPAAKVPA
jgi:hypothetical protein